MKIILRYLCTIDPQIHRLCIQRLKKKTQQIKNILKASIVAFVSRSSPWDGVEEKPSQATQYIPGQPGSTVQS